VLIYGNCWTLMQGEGGVLWQGALLADASIICSCMSTSAGCFFCLLLEWECVAAMVVAVTAWFLRRLAFLLAWLVCALLFPGLFCPPFRCSWCSVRFQGKFYGKKLGGKFYKPRVNRDLTWVKYSGRAASGFIRKKNPPLRHQMQPFDFRFSGQLGLQRS